MIHTCANCGTEFTGRKRKFCEDACTSNYRLRKQRGNDMSIYTDKSLVGKLLVCIECGCEFKGRADRIVCSNECKRIRDNRSKSPSRIAKAEKAKLTMVHKCRNCGDSFNGHKKSFCDTQCSRSYTSRDNKGDDLSGTVDKNSLGITYIKKVNCKQCNELFKPRGGCGGDGKSMSEYCSRECSFKYMSIRSEIRLATELVERIKRKDVRDKDCADRAKERATDKNERDRKALLCQGCSKSMIQNSQNCRRYCDTCASARNKESSKNSRLIHRRKYGSTGTHKQRADKYGVRYEVIDRVKVYESFGWKCQCCGVDTPESIMRTFDEPNAPTLDHIKPISLGGDHMYYNLQLLCRSCNSSKSNDWRESEQSFIHKIYATGLPIVLTSKSCLGVGVYMHKNTISYS
jgi:hypothetical protein